MLTTFLTRAEVSRHMQALHLLNELKAAYLARGAGGEHAIAFGRPGSDTLVRQATHEGIPAFSVSVRTAQQAADAKPGSGLVVQLYDAESGGLLAVMEGGHLSTLRASVVGALAADVLSREDAAQVALLGGGPAVSSALKALRLVRSIQRVTLFDSNLAASVEQALKLHQTLRAQVRACDTAEEAISRAELIVLTGAVPLEVDVVPPGALVTVLGADQSPDRPLLPPSLLARARCFSDDRHAAVPWAPALAGSLTQVLAGEVAARARPDDVTVFLSTGPAFLDLIAAWHVYERAKDDEALTRINLGA